jgi:RNA polymerase sigma-70 factor (ECF subfamily)
MERYIEGDRRAFARLFRVIEPRMRRQIRARVGNDLHTDDLVQATVLRAHAARSRYRRPLEDADTALVAWFCAIARNVATNHLRSQCRDRLQLACTDECDLADLRVDFDAEQVELAREDEAKRIAELRAAIDALPPGQRVVVHLHKIEGLPIAEVSRRLGVRDGALRVRAHRAYESLRNTIGATRRDAGRVAA